MMFLAILLQIKNFDDYMTDGEGQLLLSLLALLCLNRNLPRLWERLHPFSVSFRFWLYILCGCFVTVMSNLSHELGLNA